jgi:hypothetical protein
MVINKSVQFLILLLCIALWPAYLMAQVDSQYIEKLPNANLLGGAIQLRNFKVQFSPKDAPTQQHQISDVGLGVRFKYKKIGATVVIPFWQLNNPGAVKAQSLGLRIRWYPKNFFVFGIFQRVNGMYQSNPNLNTDVFNPDAKLRFGSVNIMRLSNYKRFNMKSTFRTVDVQKRSAGSFVINGLLEYQYFNNPTVSIDTSFINKNGLKQYNGIRTSIGGGYAYTKVLNYFQLTGLVALGPELRKLNIRTNNQNDPSNLLVVNSRLMAMASIAHNTPTFFWSVVGFYNPGSLKNSMVNVNTETSRVRIIVGKRFD